MMKLLMTFFIIVIFEGCMSSSTIPLSVASHIKAPNETIIIKKAVKGEDCSGFIGFYGSYAAAIDDALKKAPGANALINVEFSRKEMPIFRICVMVEGDAVKL